MFREGIVRHRDAEGEGDGDAERAQRVLLESELSMRAKLGLSVGVLVVSVLFVLGGKGFLRCVLVHGYVTVRMYVRVWERLP